MSASILPMLRHAPAGSLYAFHGAHVGIVKPGVYILTEFSLPINFMPLHLEIAHRAHQILALGADRSRAEPLHNDLEFAEWFGVATMAAL